MSENRGKGALLLLGLLWFASRPKKSSTPLSPKDAEEEFEKPLPAPRGLAYGQLVSSEFAGKLAAIAAELGVDPSDLMSIFAIERGVDYENKKLGDGVYHKYTLSKKAADKYTNGQTKFEGDFSYGLFGILPETAYSYGTTPAALYQMSDVEQLDLVLPYFKSKGLQPGGKNDLSQFPAFGKQGKGELSQFDQLYSAVWGGKVMIEAGLNDVIVDQAKEPEKYERNKDADVTKDGKITKKDVLTLARKARRAGSSLASP